MLVEPDSRLPAGQRATIWSELHGIWAGISPEPPRDYVAFVATHLHQLRQDAQLLAGDDEYEAHALYSQALTDIAIRWQWFALRRWLHRPDTADAYLQETLVRRSTRRQAEQAGLVEAEIEVEFEVWFSNDPQATHPPSGRRTLNPAALSPTLAVRLLPMSNLKVEVSPIAEAAIAWWHAYVAHRYARLGALAAAIVFVITLIGPYLHRH
ncbi:hypothetical protein Rhe02_44850 [Rhizocola hellebori]|uniref:Uncharacterized protein n=2 Tax=Rhizocola hellebori TaxID=1392758 RepID=A0A8J3VHY6_9ACTN|nr:hypothetical protein Rhe02_44850 [Rhizocola hellebori]